MTIFRLQRHGEVDIEFSGELIASSSSNDGTKDRWQSMNLYRVDSRGYVLERLGESRVPGEICMRNVDYLDSPGDVRRRVERKRDDGAKYLTLTALELLDQAADNDERFKAVVVERL